MVFAGSGFDGGVTWGVERQPAKVIRTELRKVPRRAHNGWFPGKIDRNLYRVRNRPLHNYIYMVSFYALWYNFCGIHETIRMTPAMEGEAVYLHELSDGFQAQRGIFRRMRVYGKWRPHSAVADSTRARSYEKRPADAEADRASPLNPSACSAGTGRHVEQDPGGRTDYLAYT